MKKLLQKRDAALLCVCYLAQLLIGTSQPFGLPAGLLVPVLAAGTLLQLVVYRLLEKRRFPASRVFGWLLAACLCFAAGYDFVKADRFYRAVTSQRFSFWWLTACMLLIGWYAARCGRAAVQRIAGPVLVLTLVSLVFLTTGGSYRLENLQPLAARQPDWLHMGLVLLEYTFTAEPLLWFYWRASPDPETVPVCAAQGAEPGQTAGQGRAETQRDAQMQDAQMQDAAETQLSADEAKAAEMQQPSEMQTAEQMQGTVKVQNAARPQKTSQTQQPAEVQKAVQAQSTVRTQDAAQTQDAAKTRRSAAVQETDQTKSSPKPQDAAQPQQPANAQETLTAQQPANRQKPAKKAARPGRSAGAPWHAAVWLRFGVMALFAVLAELTLGRRFANTPQVFGALSLVSTGANAGHGGALYHCIWLTALAVRVCALCCTLRGLCAGLLPQLPARRRIPAEGAALAAAALVWAALWQRDCLAVLSAGTLALLCAALLWKTKGGYHASHMLQKGTD